MPTDQLRLLIEGREYRVLDVSDSAADRDSAQIHSLAVAWEAPFAAPHRRVQLRAGDELRPIRVVSARFRDGAQQLAFLYA